MSQVRLLRLLIAVLGLMTTAVAISNSIMLRKHQEVEQRLLYTLKKQSDTIQYQSRVIEELKNALERQRQAPRAARVSSGRFNFE